MAKTTQKHFEIFKAECERWIKTFGLFGWKFYFQHENVDGRQIAYCIFPDKPEDRVFTLGLTVDLECEFSMIDFKKAAFHEVMEAFLYRISYLGECRYIQPEELPEERHNIIRTLENVVWKK